MAENDYPDIVNKLAQLYAEQAPVRNALSMAGIPSSPTISPELQASLYGTHEAGMQLGRDALPGMMEANPIEMATGLVGRRVPFPARISNSIRGYHGMAGELEGAAFDPKRFGQNHSDDRAGVFLTTNPETAGGWADWAASRSSREAIGDNAAIVPADVNFKNPLRVSAGNRDPSLHWYDNKDELLAAAQRGGHDGVIVESTNWRNPQSTLVAMSPGTVRSSTTGKLLYGIPALGLLAPPDKAPQQ